MGRGLRVRPADAERAHRALRERGGLAPHRKVVREEGWVVFPVTDDAVLDGLPGVEADAPFVDEPSAPGSYRSRLAALPSEVQAELPRAFDVVGEIVLVRLRPSAEPYRAEIGEALLATVPTARTVGWDRGVQGPDRRRAVVHLAGARGWRTRHRENGLLLDVDVASAYFSPRLAREHARVALQVAVGERVADVACGVGPFALTIARDGRAASVLAIDHNPAALELLRSSARRLGPAGDRIEVRLGEIEALDASAGPFDRVIFNLPHGGIKYLTTVGAMVGRGGTLHYYEMTERSDLPGRPAALVDRLGGAGRFRVEPPHPVHPYSPASDLIGYTFVRTEA